MINIPNKSIKIFILVVVVTIAGIFAYKAGSVDIFSLKNKERVFVNGTDGKVWYIKSSDCLDSVYKNQDSKDIFDKMCRAYTTDGKFVYYDGLRGLVSLPIPYAPVFINGKFASSSQPSVRQKKGPFLIEGADPKTFEIITSKYLAPYLSSKKTPTLTYSRDKDYLYRNGKKVLGVDLNTLLILGNGYIKDKNSVYFLGKELKGSDPATFEFLKNGYIRDKNFVYLMGRDKEIEGSDGSTFELLDNRGEYSKDKNNAYYRRQKIKDADAKTFRILFDDKNNMGLSGYARDKNVVYYKGKKIEGSDSSEFSLVGNVRMYVKNDNFVYSYYNPKKFPNIDAKTFEYIGGYYFKDKNNIYFGNSGSVFEGADVNTFKILGNGVYVKDKNHVWKSYSVMYGTDPATFVYLKDNYAKDKNFVYFYSFILIGADPASFEILKNRYSKDKNFVYFGKEKVIGADPATFVVVDYNYTKDKNKVYFRGEKLNDITPDSFKSFGCGYLKDNTKVFFQNRDVKLNPIIGADADSFKTMDNNPCYGMDKDSVYLASGSPSGKSSYLKIADADPKTFKVINMRYSKDKNNVYYKGALVKNANPETFKVVDARGEYMKDDKYVYYIGLRVVGADPKTFELIKGGYWKDASSVYYRGIKIEGADAETFEVNYRFGKIVKDKNTLYKEGKSITKDEFLNKGVLSPPGFVVPVPPFGAKVYTPYPIGI